MSEENINLTPGTRQMLFVLVGPTRAGKSTFINTLLGREVAQEGKERSYQSTTRSIENYNNLGLDLDAIMKLDKTAGKSENPPVIINFVDTIGMGDTSVEFTDEEIQELIKAELMDKTLCDKIDAIIILENPNSPAIQLVQTYYKITKIFGNSCKDSIMVVISQAASVSHIPEAIDQRIDECEKLNIPYIEWESKDIAEDEKQKQVKEFFEIVANRLQSYNIMKLKGLDQQLLDRARELRNDPRNWRRRIRKERQKEIIEWIRDSHGRYDVSIKTGERMMDGASYFNALKNAYRRAGDNIYFFLREEGSTKYIAVPIYAAYLAFFTCIVPMYPVFATRDEMRKMMVPIVEGITMSEDEFEEYLEPLSEQDKPDLEQMLIKARQEESESVRKTIKLSQSAKPSKTESAQAPTRTRQARQFQSAVK